MRPRNGKHAKAVARIPIRLLNPGFAFRRGEGASLEEHLWRALEIAHELLVLAHRHTGEFPGAVERPLGERRMVLPQPRGVNAGRERLTGEAGDKGYRGRGR